MIQRRLVVAIAAIAAACVLIAADAHARAGGGSSGGSRGTRTFSAPPATQTAPNAAAPMQRTLTQPGKSSTVGQTAPRPGLFGGGLLGGLAAGFLWGRFVRPSVWAWVIWRHGGLRFRPRTAVADCAGRDRRATVVRVVATAQCAGSRLRSCASGYRSIVQRPRCDAWRKCAGRSDTHDREIGLRRLRAIAG